MLDYMVLIARFFHVRLFILIYWHFSIESQLAAIIILKSYFLLVKCAFPLGKRDHKHNILGFFLLLETIQIPSIIDGNNLSVSLVMHSTLIQTICCAMYSNRLFLVSLKTIAGWCFFHFFLHIVYVC